MHALLLSLTGGRPSAYHRQADESTDLPTVAFSTSRAWIAAAISHAARCGKVDREFVRSHHRRDRNTGHQKQGFPGHGGAETADEPRSARRRKHVNATRNSSCSSRLERGFDLVPATTWWAWWSVTYSGRNHPSFHRLAPSSVDPEEGTQRIASHGITT